MQQQINHNSKSYILSFDHRCSLLGFIPKLCVCFILILNRLISFQFFFICCIFALWCWLVRLTVLLTSSQMKVSCSKWNETFRCQIHRFMLWRRGAEEEAAADAPAVTREITQLKLPEQQPVRVYRRVQRKALAQFVWYVRRSVFWFWSFENCELAGLLIAETALI